MGGRRRRAVRRFKRRCRVGVLFSAGMLRWAGAFRCVVLGTVNGATTVLRVKIAIRWLALIA